MSAPLFRLPVQYTLIYAEQSEVVLGEGFEPPKAQSHLVYSEAHLTALVPQRLPGAVRRD